MKQSTCAIGIDVGGTKCAGGLVMLPGGERLAERVQPTRPERGGEAVLDDVRAMALALCDEARRRGIEPVGIGVGVCELVDRQGRIASEATVRWKDVPVAERIRAATELPTYIDADVRAAARGEAALGAGRGLDVFLYVTIGTGISSCLVLDGVPYEGASGLAGTFASSENLVPACDGTLKGGPSLEEYAAGPALAARLAERRAGFAGTARDVVALAEAGDIKAQEIVERAGGAVGAAVAHLVNVLDPQAVVLGGGLGLAGGQYRRALDAVLRAYVWSERHRDIRLLDGELGPDAGWIGAAMFAARGRESFFPARRDRQGITRVVPNVGGLKKTPGPIIQTQRFADHETMSRHSADWLSERLRETPDALFCLASGMTPMRAYELLAERYAVEPQLFGRMRVIKLDEWGGLAMNDPASCEQHLRRAVIDPLGLADRYTSFDGESAAPHEECDRVARWLAENGPIDICVLGLGVNGHIGFNEPGPFLQPHAHVAQLSPTSLDHSMLRHTDVRPTYGLTLGMADILQSRHILLLVSGPTKREPLARLITGRISTEFPASLLALHTNVHLLCAP